MESYERLVGLVAHQTIGDVMRSARGLGLSAQTAMAWETAGEHVRDLPSFGSRARAGRLAAASAADVYLRYFAPPATWILTGVEVMLGDGRVDLEWLTDRSTVVYDELKLASTPGRHRGNGPARRQALGYLSHGMEVHGPSFDGVRLLLLGAPRHSMHFGRGGRLRRLVETPLWFERDRGVAA